MRTSGYYDYVRRIGLAENDAELAEKFRNVRGLQTRLEMVSKQKHSKESENCSENHEKYGFLSEIRRRRKWVNLGRQVHKYENLLKRQFRADRPNTK